MGLLRVSRIMRKDTRLKSRIVTLGTLVREKKTILCLLRKKLLVQYSKYEDLHGFI